jgi:hypothetical protein
VFAQITRLQAKAVDRLDDGPKQRAKSIGDLPHFVVEWMLTDVLIEVADQMDEAVLLLAGETVVCRVKV